MVSVFFGVLGCVRVCLRFRVVRVEVGWLEVLGLYGSSAKAFGCSWN